MTAQSPSKGFGVKGGSQSWAIHYGKGFDYITQSAQSGEIFIGGALTNSDPLSEIGNSRDDMNCVRSIAHLGGIMDATFGRPVREEIKTAWTGVMGFSIDGYPIVGKLPDAVTERKGGDDGGEWAAAGFGGYGMVNSFLSGQAVAEMLLGKAPAILPRSHVMNEERYELLVKELKRRLEASVKLDAQYKALL